MTFNKNTKAEWKPAIKASVYKQLLVLIGINIRTNPLRKETETIANPVLQL